MIAWCFVHGMLGICESNAALDERRSFGNMLLKTCRSGQDVAERSFASSENATKGAAADLITIPSLRRETIWFRNSSP